MSKSRQISQTPPGVRVGPLETAADVRRELGRLYRAARQCSGPAPDAATAAKLGYLLQVIGRSIEGCELERRIIELESNVRQKAPK